MTTLTNNDATMQKITFKYLTNLYAKRNLKAVNDYIDWINKQIKKEKRLNNKSLLIKKLDWCNDWLIKVMPGLDISAELERLYQQKRKKEAYKVKYLFNQVQTNKLNIWDIKSDNLREQVLTLVEATLPF